MQQQALWILSSLLVWSMGCSGPAEPLPEQALLGASSQKRKNVRVPPPDPEYVDVTSYIAEDADVNAWYALVANLERDFDSICGDTFCEGDFSNYRSLAFRCTVDGRGTLGECAWTLAASQHEVVPRTGRMDVLVEHWVCPIPLAPRLPLTELMTVLSSAPSPLYTALPRSQLTPFDALSACL